MFGGSSQPSTTSIPLGFRAPGSHQPPCPPPPWGSATQAETAGKAIVVSWSSPQVSDASASEIETVSIMVSRDGPIDAGHHDDDTDRARWTVRRREGKVGNVVRHLDPDQCLALRHSYSFARRPVEAEVGDGPFAVKLGQYTLLKENAPNDCQYSCRVLEANLRAAAVLAGLMVASWTAGATPVVVTVLGWILLIRGIGTRRHFAKTEWQVSSRRCTSRTSTSCSPSHVSLFLVHGTR